MKYSTASKSKLVDQMENFERFTTLMYRPPEMIDQFFKYPVTEKVDIWVSLEVPLSIDVWLCSILIMLL